MPLTPEQVDVYTPEPIEDAGRVVTDLVRSAGNLCLMTHFAWRKVVNARGVAHLALISRYKTMAVNQELPTRGSGRGDCKYVCAKLYVNKGRGTLLAAIRSENTWCVGRTANVSGRMRIVLRAMIRGTVMMFSTSTECAWR